MKKIYVLYLMLAGSAFAQSSICDAYKKLQTEQKKPFNQVGVILKFTPTVESPDVYKVIDAKDAVYAYSAIEASGETVFYRPGFSEKPATNKDPGVLLINNIRGFPVASDTKAFWFFFVYDLSSQSWSPPKLDKETFAGVGDYKIKDGDMIALVLQRSGYSSTKDSGLPDLSKCPK